jgi:hypothetical protein
VIRRRGMGMGYVRNNPLVLTDPSGMSCSNPNDPSIPRFTDTAVSTGTGYPGCLAYGTEGCISDAIIDISNPRVRSNVQQGRFDSGRSGMHFESGIRRLFRPFNLQLRRSASKHYGDVCRRRKHFNFLGSRGRLSQ